MSCNKKERLEPCGVIEAEPSCQGMFDYGNIERPKLERGRRLYQIDIDKIKRPVLKRHDPIQLSRVSDECNISHSSSLENCLKPTRESNIFSTLQQESGRAIFKQLSNVKTHIDSSSKEPTMESEL